MSEYQGYKNYPTFTVAILIRNDQDQVKYLEARLEDMAEQIWLDGGKDTRRIVEEALDQLAYFVAGWVLGFVDWREVVEAAFPDETAYKIVSGIVEQMEV